MARTKWCLLLRVLHGIFDEDLRFDLGMISSPGVHPRFAGGAHSSGSSTEKSGSPRLVAGVAGVATEPDTQEGGPSVVEYVCVMLLDAEDHLGLPWIALDCLG